MIKELLIKLIGIISIIILILILIALLVPRMSTKTVFNLTEIEHREYTKRANNGDYIAINRLYMYYQLSIHDCNRSIDILRKGAMFGDKHSQYRLSMHLLETNYFPCEKIIFNRKERYILAQ